MQSEQELKKRTWVYLQSPKEYGVPGCSCGNATPEWSEFQDHLWCDKCPKDFKPENWGVFDGPIPVRTAGLLGMCFDRFNLETQTVEKFNEDSITWEPKP